MRSDRHADVALVELIAFLLAEFLLCRGQALILVFLLEAHPIDALPAALEATLGAAGRRVRIGASARRSIGCWTVRARSIRGRTIVRTGAIGRIRAIGCARTRRRAGASGSARIGVAVLVGRREIAGDL